MTATIYDSRLLFTLKLATNMMRLTDEARKDALEQYPDEVRLDVERNIRLRNLLRRKGKDDDTSR